MSVRTFEVAEPLVDDAHIAELRRCCDARLSNRGQNPMNRGDVRIFLTDNLGCDGVRSYLKSTALQELVGRFVRRPQLYHEQFVIKRNGPEGNFGWHQDGAYEDTAIDYVAVWLALDATTAENGGLELATEIPGEIMVHRPDRNKDHTFCYQGGSARLSLDAGSAVAFSSSLPHRSGPNTTSMARRAHVSFWTGVEI